MGVRKKRIVKMKVAIATDTHFNFANENNIDDFVKEILVSGAKYLLLTGDIAEGRCVDTYLILLLNKVKMHIPDFKILFVLGNHDYYGYSFLEIEDRVRKLSSDVPELIWLTDNKIYDINSTAIVGTEGWYDGRNGDYENTNLRLSDMRLIKDFIGKDREYQLKVMKHKTDTSANYLAEILPYAYSQGYRKFIVATHVPPYKEASYHNGKMADDNGLPFFSNQSVGNALTEFCMQHEKDVKLQVYAGHSHSPCSVDILPNLSVLVGNAEYYKPHVYKTIIL